MSEIAKLYDQVMANTEIEKTASDVAADGGPEFDRSFFEKVAAGDEEAVDAINSFIAEAQADGHSDDEIESAIAEAMEEAGVDADDIIGDEGQDEFEQRKVAAYSAGAEKALEDVLGSPMAKEAGVTMEDIVDFELGGHYGVGYAETRKELEQMVEKIAAGKIKAGYEGAKKALTGAMAKMKGSTKTYFAGGDPTRMAAKHLAAAPTGSFSMGEKKQLLGAMKAQAARTGFRRKAVAGAVGGTAALGTAAAIGRASKKD